MSISVNGASISILSPPTPVVAISEQDHIIQQVREECAAFKEPNYVRFFKVGIIVTVITVITGIAGVVLWNEALVISSIIISVILLTKAVPRLRERSKILKGLQDCKIEQKMAAIPLQDLQTKCEEFNQRIKGYVENSHLTLQEIKSFHQEISEEIKKELMSKEQKMQVCLSSDNFTKLNVWFTSLKLDLTPFESTQGVESFKKVERSCYLSKLKMMASKCESITKKVQEIKKVREAMIEMLQVRL